MMRLLKLLRAYIAYMSSYQGAYEWQYYMKAIGLAILCMLLGMLLLYICGV